MAGSTGGWLTPDRGYNCRQRCGVAECGTGSSCAGFDLVGRVALGCIDVAVDVSDGRCNCCRCSGVVAVRTDGSDRGSGVLGVAAGCGALGGNEISTVMAGSTTYTGNSPRRGGDKGGADRADVAGCGRTGSSSRALGLVGQVADVGYVDVAIGMAVAADGAVVAVVPAAWQVVQATAWPGVLVWLPVAGPLAVIALTPL